MDEPTKDAILSAVKLGLVAIGTWATQLGLANDAKVTATTTMLMTVIVAGWAIWDRLQKSKAQKTAVVAAVNAGVAYSNQTPDVTPPVSAAEAKAVIQQFAPAVQPATEGKP